MFVSGQMPPFRSPSPAFLRVCRAGCLTRRRVPVSLRSVAFCSSVTDIFIKQAATCFIISLPAARRKFSIFPRCMFPLRVSFTSLSSFWPANRIK